MAMLYNYYISTPMIFLSYIYLYRVIKFNLGVPIYRNQYFFKINRFTDIITYSP